LSPAAYLKWMSDSNNGMVKQKEINGLIYEVKYLTPESMALNELRTTDPGKENFEKVEKRYKGMDYFIIRLFDKSGSHIHNYLQKEGRDPDAVEAYLNYSAEKDWQMLSGNDTTKCALFTFSKTYGVSNEFACEMAYAADSARRGNDITVEWNDRALDNGTLKFLFSAKDLDRIPQIRL